MLYAYSRTRGVRICASDLSVSAHHQCYRADSGLGPMVLEVKYFAFTETHRRSCPHEIPISCPSASAGRLRVFWVLLTLIPLWIRSNRTLEGGFRSVWLSQAQQVIRQSSQSCPDLSYTLSLITLPCRLMCSMYRRHLLTKVYNLCAEDSVIRQRDYRFNRFSYNISLLLPDRTATVAPGVFSYNISLLLPDRTATVAPGVFSYNRALLLLDRTATVALGVFSYNRALLLLDRTATVGPGVRGGCSPLGDGDGHDASAVESQFQCLAVWKSPSTLGSGWREALCKDFCFPRRVPVIGADERAPLSFTAWTFAVNTFLTK